ncbi:D-alanyl-D-alanine carboxypeptidase family protein [Paenibacillus tarimensis]
MNGNRMVKLLKPVIAAFLSVFMMLTIMVSAAGAEGHVDNALGLKVSSAFLIDVETGQVLFEAEAEEALPPASMSKMMTEYIVLQEIKSGRLNWTDTVTVGRNAATTTRQGSHVFLAEGDKHSVEELFIAMAVGSANDASIALAEQIEGTEEAFAQRMNKTAKELGLETAHYINATGLSRSDMSPEYQPSSISGETLMSAKDSALLAYHILKEYDEEFLRFSSIPSYKFRERDDKPMINYNWMLEGNKDIQNFKDLAYEGLDGMKTGYTSQAQYCFTGTAERNGMRLVGVVMGADTQRGRFVEMEKLLDYGFNNFEKKTVVPPKTVVETIETVKIKKGVKTEVPVVTQNDISFLVQKGSTPQIELTESNIKDANELVAPIAAGTVVGNVTYKYTDADGNELLRTVNLVTSEEAEKGSWWRLTFRAIKDFFAGLFDGIVNLF